MKVLTKSPYVDAPITIQCVCAYCHAILEVEETDLFLEGEEGVLLVGYKCLECEEIILIPEEGYDEIPRIVLNRLPVLESVGEKEASEEEETQETVEEEES